VTRAVALSAVIRGNFLSNKTALQNPTPKRIEFETTAVYSLGKTTMTVDSVFKPDGVDITHILSRLMIADIDNN